jgi:hypothetical protein
MRIGYDIDVSSVSAPLVIGRSGITIRGASKFNTFLRRQRLGAAFATSEKIPIMSVATPGPALSGVTITDLAFDGNRTFNEGLGDPGVALDLSISNVNGSQTFSPFTVRNCRFLNSPGSAISMQPAIDYPVEFPGTQPTRGIRIEKNEFRKSRRAPVHVALNGEWWPITPPPSTPVTPLAAGQIYVSGMCDGGLPAESTVDDVVVQYNLFEENDTGALGINDTQRFSTNPYSMYSVRAYRNVFLDNYNAGADCGGGVVAVLNCAHDVEIRENFMWNRNVLWEPGFCPSTPQSGSFNTSDRWAVADAMEIWGKHVDVVGNLVQYFSASGIAAAAVQNLTVTGNKINNTSRGIQQRPDLNDLDYENDRPGILVSNCGDDSGGAHRPVVGVQINSNEVLTRARSIKAMLFDLVAGFVVVVRST